MAEKATVSDPIEQGIQPQEDGNVSFEDGGLDDEIRSLVDGDTVEHGDEDEKAETVQTEKSEPEDESGSELYTEDEFLALDPFEVDPAKLPGAAGEVHKRYLQVYKEQILPELEQLRAFKQRVMADAQRAQAQRDPRQEFLNEVRARTMRSLGVQELDELNQEHVVELSRQSAMLQSEIQMRSGEEQARRQQAQHMEVLRVSLREEFPDFDGLDRFAKTEMENLPYAKAQKVISDLMSGEPSRVRAVYQMFAERKAQRAKPAVKPKQETPPPALIDAGGGVRERKPWNYKEFATADRDDQSRMLIEAGLVDD